MLPADDPGCDYARAISKMWRFTMSITFDLPAAVEQQLRREVTNLDVLAKEAAIVEFYRQGTMQADRAMNGVADSCPVVFPMQARRASEGIRA
jgi:hypothetical protein